MAQFQRLCNLGDLAEGLGRTFYLRDLALAVFLVNGKVHVIDDTCPHMGASLGCGFVENGTVTCPWHFWRFRLDDGKWADNPRMGINCYPTRIVGDEVQVQIPTPGEQQSSGERQP
jgi:nitrite reductase (NADH) small subunit/3-phenylpropionate/trans-cinnamate dioxygenase ferredoxin subunit